MSADHREQLEEAIERVKNVHMLAVKQVQDAHPQDLLPDPPKVAQSAFKASTLRVSVDAYLSFSSMLPKVPSAPILVEGVKCGLVTEPWGQPGGQVQRVDSLEPSPA
jgi:hypothetical protein